ncbi:MAG: GTPase Era [Bacteroidales bacterium]|nr:GTPase Era [Bacteroidales bacterium]
MPHKSGFVNIIGNPNVGKSTLMNELVGEKLSIITPKAQTTRHRILGIVSGDDYQVVFSDTPGIIKPAYRLQENMMKTVRTAFTDADLILYLTDVKETPDSQLPYVKKIRNCKVPVLLAVNKIDLVSQPEVEKLLAGWREIVKAESVIPISALHTFNVKELFSEILRLIPEGPEYFPKEILTDRPERFFVSEIIREKILRNYREEIPYSCQVEIESFKEGLELDKIRAIIYVLRESQKGIIIGHKGEALKKTGTQARIDIEKFLGKKVFLELHVKVAEDWRDSEKKLKGFGY